MQRRGITFTYQTGYYTLNKPEPSTEFVWLVFHGYGQLAEYFIKKFELLDPAKHSILAPEGLNRFYLEGFSGRVGANWMTREHRLEDITNYLSYIDQVYELEIDPFLAGKKLILLGFSQGTATVCRWITHARPEFHKLILWAGIFPPDLALTGIGEAFGSKPIEILYGDQDRYINNDRREELNRLLEKYQLNPVIKEYTGGHQIMPELLESLTQ